MADNTGIEWTDATWNPTVGCSVISPGCTNCYAMKMAGRLEAMGQPIYRGHTIKTKAGYVWNGKVAASNWGQMIKPLSWKKPRRIFVNSMSDLFHEDMPEAVIDQVFAVMSLCTQHTFQVLTKRAERMRDYIGTRGDFMPIAEAADEILHQRRGIDIRAISWDFPAWPLPNVHLGVSAEDQPRADERIPHLIETPAAVRFLSCEPLLGPIEFKKVPGFNRVNLDLSRWWIIAGGESGPGKRPMEIEWMRSLRDQCAIPGVPFFPKQWDKVRELPDDLRVRQFPATP